jgi:hypothetical protein
MVLANQNEKLTSPDQGFLVPRVVYIRKPWERGCDMGWQKRGKAKAPTQILAKVLLWG